MRTFLVTAVLAGAVLSLAPGQAAEAYCTYTNGNLGDDGTLAWSCTFLADDLPHGYAGAIPNDFDVFLDIDGDGSFDEIDGDTLIAEVSPSSGEPTVGALELETASSYTVRIWNGCAGTCGHIGSLSVK